MKIHSFLDTARRQALFAAVALGLALGASGAWAQTAPAESGADAAQTPAGDDAPNKGDPDAVVVHGERRHPPPMYHGSTAYAEAAAKQAAWQAYRDSTATPTPGSCSTPPSPTQDPGCGTLAGSKDYPGLRTLLGQ